MRLRVGHLYPDYLNIYADRGNIAVLAGRAARRGLELDITAVGLGETPQPGAYDLLYVGGGQDREQALIAPDMASKGPALAEAVDRGAAFLEREMDAGRLRRYDTRQLLLTGYGAVLSYFSDAPLIGGLLDDEPMSPAALAVRREHVIDVLRSALEVS